MAIIRYYPVNRLEFESRYSTHAACYEAIALIRLRKSMQCPKCGNVGGTFILSTVRSRGMTWKKRYWNCRKCRRRTSALDHTIFDDTRIPLQDWFRLLWWMCSTDELTSSRKALLTEVQAKEGFHIGGTWCILRRIRQALLPREQISGEVQLGLTHVQGLCAAYGRTEAPAIVLAKREPYAATIATLPEANAEAIREFAIQHITPGSVITTSNSPCFDALAEAGFTHVKTPQSHTNSRFARLLFVDELSSHLNACMEKAHHAQVGESNLPEFFAEWSFRHAYAYKSVGRRFYSLLRTLLNC